MTQKKTQPQIPRSWLYHLVYSSVTASYVAFLLIGIFLFQGVERAYAADEEAATTDVVNTAPITDDLLSRLEDTPVTPLTLEETAQLSNSEVVVDASPTIPDTPSLVATEPSSPLVDPVLGVDPALVATTSSSTAEESPEVATTIQHQEQVSTTSTPIAASADQTVAVVSVQSDAVLQFSKTNCVAVADGSFYCQAASTTAPESDGLYSLPDADGDLEIYLKHLGELTQITHNTVDDASPYYDQTSNTIVWHRFVDDRYQIMSYDVSTGKEEQLTNTTANNMEPYRAGTYTVWQHWDNDAWQVMLYDGTTIQQLTHSIEHNLAPSIRNGLVVWHRVYSNEQTIQVYDLTTKTLMTIKNSDGATISNPRMVLVFDETGTGGEAVTKGYDLLTGEITDFSESPKPLPDEIPDPEASGTTKALVHPKSNSEDEGDNLLSQNDNPATSGLVPLTSDLTLATTSTNNLTLDLTTATTTEQPSVGDIATSSDTTHIADVVLLPFDDNFIASSTTAE